MNEFFVLVAFLVLVGLLASRMERDQREHTIQDELLAKVGSNNLLGAVTPTMPELPAQSPGSKR